MSGIKTFLAEKVSRQMGENMKGMALECANPIQVAVHGHAHQRLSKVGFTRREATDE